jgi:hypothetical protein
MFINLKHKQLDVYKSIRELVKETYSVSLKLPADESLIWFSKFEGPLYF